MTPQEKKAHSLKKDCRNTYGENDKSSRKSIRFRKRWVNRTFRRESNQAIESTPVETIQEGVAAVQRKSWKKSPDSPLGEKLLRDQTLVLEYDLWQASQENPSFVDNLNRNLLQHNLSKTRVQIIMRRVRAITLDRGSSSLDLNSIDLALLAEFVQQEISR